MRFFRRKRPCEACGKVVGRTEKAVEYSFKNILPPHPPIIVHQSCWDAAPKYSFEMKLAPNEGFSAKPSY